MRKQSKRRIRPASEPAMVRLAMNPEIEVTERLAIQAMRGGWSDYHNSYKVLADCHGILTIGTRRKNDISLRGVLQASQIALLNIYDRYFKTKKFGATGDELHALEMLVDVAHDFWARQSSTALEIAIDALRIVRKHQYEDAKRKAA